MRHMLSTLVVVGVISLSSKAAAGQHVGFAARDYSPETYVTNIPPNVTRSFKSIMATMTRDNWPGVGTTVLPALAEETTLVLGAGEGSKFPLAFGWLTVTNGDESESMWLVSRLGNVLTVKRGDVPELYKYFGTAPIPRIAILAGATVRLRDLVTLVFERTINGTDWIKVGAATFEGGFAGIDPTTGKEFVSGVGFSQRKNGNLIALPGDTRVSMTTRVILRSSFDITATEPEP